MHATDLRESVVSGSRIRNDADGLRVCARSRSMKSAPLPLS